MKKGFNYMCRCDPKAGYECVGCNPLTTERDCNRRIDAAVRAENEACAKVAEDCMRTFFGALPRRSKIVDAYSRCADALRSTPEAIRARHEPQDLASRLKRRISAMVTSDNAIGLWVRQDNALRVIDEECSR